MARGFIHGSGATPRVGSLLAARLARITSWNVGDPSTTESPKSLGSFLGRFASEIGCCPECYVRACAYLNRYITINQSVAITALNVRSLLLASLAVAIKFQENSFTNFDFAAAGEISVREMNRIEREFLMGIDYCLFVNDDVFDAYCYLLQREATNCSNSDSDLDSTSDSDSGSDLNLNSSSDSDSDSDSGSNSDSSWYSNLEVNREPDLELGLGSNWDSKFNSNLDSVLDAGSNLDSESDLDSASNLDSGSDSDSDSALNADSGSHPNLNFESGSDSSLDLNSAPNLDSDSKTTSNSSSNSDSDSGLALSSDSGSKSGSYSDSDSNLDSDSDWVLVDSEEAQLN